MLDGDARGACAGSPVAGPGAGVAEGAAEDAEDDKVDDIAGPQPLRWDELPCALPEDEGDPSGLLLPTAHASAPVSE